MPRWPTRPSTGAQSPRRLPARTPPTHRLVLSHSAAGRLGEMDTKLQECEASMQRKSRESKKMLTTQLRGVQSEVALLASKIDDRLPHLAFAQDLDAALGQYQAFEKTADEMRAGMASMKESFASTVSEIEHSHMQLESAVKSSKAEASDGLRSSDAQHERGLEELSAALQRVRADGEATASALEDVRAEVQEVAATTEAVVDKAAAELWAGLANHKAKQELDVADLCNLLHESEQDFSELLQQLDHGICRRITDVETRLTETLAGQMAAAEASAASALCSSKVFTGGLVMRT